MIKFVHNGRKFIVKTQYSPAGVNRSSIRKAIKRLEKLANADGLISVSTVRSVLESAKPAHKKMVSVLVDDLGNVVDETTAETTRKDLPAPPKFTRRKTTISVYEEVVEDGEVVLKEVLTEAVVNDSKEPFTRDYGRSLGMKKAAFHLVKSGFVDSEFVNSFESAFKTTIPASANTWDAIDPEYVERLLF